MQRMQWCPIPSYDQNQGLRGRQDSGTLQLYGPKSRSKTGPRHRHEPNSLDQDVHGIEIKKGLEGHVGENEEGK